jgi:hypothetical protein
MFIIIVSYYLLISGGKRRVYLFVDHQGLFSTQWKGYNNVPYLSGRAKESA